MATERECFEVLQEFIDEHHDEPELLKYIGQLITNGTLAQSLERTSNNGVLTAQADAVKNSYLLQEGERDR